ncbi:hypothetical protein P389DRAFT_211260 [Cystobasidium minutum MCA 4210]|uniref:uncharacterized protein n=1 Tax=Cystobasidium minutum MCA 4210 TaxID=1397322 RepID=UPI0034CE1607|eukprot:jgi/Rhomi1/211260/estExt_Genemark1.C_4_t20418
MPTIFQQLPNGILSRALTFLPTRDLLELMLVSWKHYQIAVPSAYRSLSINGVYELERLLDMLYSTETAISFDSRSLALNNVRRLVLSVCPVIAAREAPLDLAQAPAAAEEEPMRTDDGIAPDSPTPDLSVMAVDNPVPPAQQRRHSPVSERSDSPEVIYDGMYMLNSANVMRDIFDRLQASRKALFDEIMKHAEVTRHEATDYDPPYPFFRLTSLTLTTLTYPARGAMAPPSLEAPFRSVRHLEVHVLLGRLLTQVWQANLRELWQFAPFVTRLTIICEDDSIFSPRYIHFHTIPLWAFLDTVQIVLRGSYKNTLGGDTWCFGEEVGGTWVRRIVGHFRKMLVDRCKQWVFEHATFGGQTKCRLRPTYIPKLKIVLSLPPESVIMWNHEELVHRFNEEQAALNVPVTLDVTLDFAPAERQRPDLGSS